MTGMTGPDCGVMCKLINTHTHTERDRNANEDGNRKGSEDRTGEGEREAKKHKKPYKSCRDATWETGETWVERRKHVEKKGLVQ